MKIKLRIFLSAQMIILALSFLGIQTAAAETYRVHRVESGDVLNIRKKPSVKSKRIGSIPPSGKGIKKLGPCKRVWCKISYRGVTGWSSMKYLKAEKLVKPSAKSVEEVKNLLNQAGLGALINNPDSEINTPLPKVTRSQINTPLPKVTRSQINTPLPKVTRSQINTPLPKVSRSKNNTNITSYEKIMTSAPIRQNEIKSKPYKLDGKTYFIEVSGTVNYKTDPNITDNSGIYGVDACYLFSFTPSKIKAPPVAIKLLKSTGNNDVCANATYNPKHIYRSKPFISKNKYQFWIDNTAYRAIPNGTRFLTVKIYETNTQK